VCEIERVVLFEIVADDAAIRRLDNAVGIIGLWTTSGLEIC
jgi:hypothetical protein